MPEIGIPTFRNADGAEITGGCKRRLDDIPPLINSNGSRCSLSQSMTSTDWGSS